jgi:hypothetical protein
MRVRGISNLTRNDDEQKSERVHFKYIYLERSAFL